MNKKNIYTVCWLFNFFREGEIQNMPGFTAKNETSPKKWYVHRYIC